MTPGEYLDAVKQAIGIESDNALAKHFEIHRMRISAYRSGREWPDNYLVAKIAIDLNLDPASVLADLESQHEKNPKRVAFWQSFLSRAAMLAVVTCTLALNFTVTSGAGTANSSPLAWSGYPTIIRIIRRYVSWPLSHCETR